MIVAVLDTTVLSNFAHIGQAELLLDAFDQPCVTEVVIFEQAEGVITGRLPYADWSRLPIVELTVAEQQYALELAEALGDGEATCLAVAVSRGWQIVTDDLTARRLGKSLGVSVSGTLGALKNLMNAQIITRAEGDALLSMMIAKGYHSPVQSLADV
ncbi:MAG: DUF3368 domain-containing protein [bacterium]|nr:DUF3368 domain-containing protein [bacterium]